MAKLLTNTSYKSVDGTVYRIEMYDNNSSPVSSGSEVELSPEGFTIQWEGDTESPSPAFLPSAMSITMFLNEVQHGHFTSAVYDEAEYNVVVKLFRTDENDNEFLEWVGLVLPESFTEVIEDGYIQCSMRAIDGIAALKNINFVDDAGDQYFGTKTMIEWLYECLKRVPTYAYMFNNLALEGFITEYMLLRPNTATYSAWANSIGVMGSYEIHSANLYRQEISESRDRKDYELVKAPAQSPIIPVYEVLHNIVSSMGATLCLSEGHWHLFDRERVINQGHTSAANKHQWFFDGVWASTTQTLTSPNDFDADNKNMLRGATRRGMYAIRTAVQKFLSGGSDLVWRSGMGSEPTDLTPADTFYNQKIWHILKIYSSSSLVGVEPYFPATGVAHTREIPHLRGDSQFMPDDGIIGGLALANGTDGGQFTMHLSGNASYDTFPTTFCGTTSLYRQFIEASDGTNSFRFRRRMRTYPYSSNGTYVSSDISGVSARYVARYLESGFWVKDTDARYETAYFDIMIGNDDTVHEWGSSDEFLGTQYTSTTFYTPPGTTVSPDNDNELIHAPDRSSYTWRFKHALPFPSEADGVGVGADIVSMRFWNPQYLEIANVSQYAKARNSSGTTIDVPLTVALDRTDFLYEVGVFATAFSTKTEQGWTGTPRTNYSNTDKFQLSGMEVYVGDGTETWDILSYATPTTPKGTEVMKLETTALGATTINSGNRTFGRWLATHHLGGGAEDNLIFSPFNEPATTYGSMGEYVTNSAIQVRGDIRTVISGTVIVNGAAYGKNLLRPYRQFVTDKFGAGSTEWYTPLRMSYSGNGQQTVEAISSGTWTRKPSSETDVVSGFTGGADGVGSGGGIEPVGGGDKLRAWNKLLGAIDVTEHIDTSAFTGTITLNEIETAVDKIQTTAPITDADLGGSGTTSTFGDLFPMFIKRN